MIFIRILVLVFCFHFASAEPEKAGDFFNLGTQAYVQKDYARAAQLFQQALDKDPFNETVLTNLALSQFQLGKKVLALGLLRKALAIQPDEPTAQAGLKFVLSQIQVKDVPHKIETYETVRSLFLKPVSLFLYLLFSGLTLFAAGWIFISYSARRKKALDTETIPPGIPWTGIFLGLLFIFSTTLLGFKAYDQFTIVRGTIIEEQVSLQTAPGDNQVNILELFGGMEVVINTVRGDWAQVTYPGALTGWIKKSTLVMTR